MTKLWNDSLMTGVPLMDQQHKALIHHIENFDALCASAQTHRALDELLPQLKDYVKYHFSEEENLMQQLANDYEQLQEHQAIHQRFITQLEDMEGQRANWGDLQTAIRMRTYLHDWLVHHIAGTDQSLARQLLSQHTPPAR
jgi:voltage-gated potassium channel